MGGGAWEEKELPRRAWVPRGLGRGRVEPRDPSYAAGAPQLGMPWHPQFLYVIRKLETGVPRGTQEKEAKSKGLKGSLFPKAVMGMCVCPRARATVASQGLFQSLGKGRSCQILPSLHGNLALPVSHCPFSSPQPHCDHLHASGTIAPWKEKKVGTSPSSRGFFQSPLERSCLACARKEVHDFSTEGCGVWA